jgi:molybdopterin converting factor small subunit
MKKTAVFIIVAVFALYAWDNLGLREHFAGPVPDGASAIAEAYQNQRSDLQVRGSGTVVRVLPDDNDGSRHQRFILELETGQTLLVAHNIDLAPRIAPLKRGDTVEFFGEYEWNARGGVIHWTHHDPRGRHVGGWLRHDGRTYQ